MDEMVDVVNVVEMVEVGKIVVNKMRGDGEEDCCHIG
jgi:hypothetical protein